MEIEELRRLYNESEQRIAELEFKYRAGMGLSRKDCNDMRKCVQRIGLVARELWIMSGRPDDPMFDNLRQPIPLSPLPEFMRRDGH